MNSCAALPRWAALLVLAWGSFANANEPLRVSKGNLDISIESVDVLGSYIVSYVLRNRDEDFYCISYGSLDAQHVEFTGKDDGLVELNEISDPPFEDHLGVNYSEPYLILEPGSQRKVSIDMSKFAPMDGIYRYEAVFLYFRCADVIDRSRIRARRTIQGYVSDAKGEVTVRPPVLPKRVAPSK